MTLRFKVGERQASAIELYFLDPVFADDPRPFEFVDGVLTTDDADATHAALTDRANACDDYSRESYTVSAEERVENRKDRDALTALASRVLRAGAKRGL